MIRVLFTLLSRLRRVGVPAFAKVAVATVVVVAFSATGFMYFELAGKPDLTWGDALWWSVVTMTTVGYGDHFPTSWGGRYLIAVPTMIIGISILGYLLSVVATYLIEARSKELRGMGETSLSEHVLIIHYQSSDRVLEIVNELKHDERTRECGVLLIDADLEELPPELVAEDVQFVRGLATKEATLRRASVDDAAYVFVLARDRQDPSSDDHTLAVALTVERLVPELITVAECIDPEHVELMYKSGCDSVVCIAEMASTMIVQEALDPGLQVVLKELASTSVGQQLFVVEFEGKPRPFSETANELAKQRALALGVVGSDGVELNPDPFRFVNTGEKVVCMAKKRPETLG